MIVPKVQHNKTQELTVEELPFNPKNVLLQMEDVQGILAALAATAR